MKIYNSLKVVLFSVFLVLNIVSCTEEEDNNYTNKYLVDNNLNVTYTNIDTYPYQKKFVSDAPSFDIDHSVYQFKLIDVKLTDGTSVNLNDFSINAESGIITIDNTKGVIVPGETYHFDIGIDNVNGTILKSDTFVLTVLDIPLDYTITNDTAEAGFLEEKDLATITYVDTSTDGVIADVSYSLENPPTGFAIDSETGVISKDTSAESGVHAITIVINSNLGSKAFEDVLTVTVGDSPTLQYVQADGTTNLTKTVLSPWTSYTTQIPNLQGMTAVEYEIILPATLTDGSVIANNDGTIKVLADQDLALGDHILGVKVTNSSGISTVFDNIFTLSVETRWESPSAFSEDFNNAPDPGVDPNSYNTALNNYDLYNSAASFKVANTFSDKSGKEKDLFTVKLSDDGKKSPDELVDAAFVLELELNAKWRKMRVSFNEDFGFGSDRLNWYERSFQVGYDVSDLIGGAYNTGNWTTIMGPNDTSWSGVSGWSGIQVDSDLNVVSFKDITINSGNQIIYLNWRVQKIGTSGKGAAFLIDDIVVEVSGAFIAEEF